MPTVFSIFCCEPQLGDIVVKKRLFMLFCILQCGGLGTFCCSGQLETNLVVNLLTVYLCTLRVGSWVQVSLLPYPCVADRKLLLLLVQLKKLGSGEVFKVTRKLSVCQENLILPVHFCKQLLLWLIDVSFRSGLKTGCQCAGHNKFSCFQCLSRKNRFVVVLETRMCECRLRFP